MPRSENPQSDFDKFVKSEQAQAESVDDVVDWAKEKAEWLGFLDILYAKVEEYLRTYIEAKQIVTWYSDIEINEEGLGIYMVRRLFLKIGGKEISFTPIGTMLIGTKGRVDVDGPAGKARLMLVSRKATGARSLVNVTVSIDGKPITPPKAPAEPIEWTWKIVTMPPEINFIDLAKEPLFQMIMEVANG